MKAKSKSELAELAGVSVCTLVNWFKPHMAELEALGLKPRMRVLPPKRVLKCGTFALSEGILRDLILELFTFKCSKCWI